jgi:hypothetical protein
MKNKPQERVNLTSLLMTSGWKEWDEQILRSCFYNHDIEVIKRIRLSDRIEEDVIAWHY